MAQIQSFPLDEFTNAFPHSFRSLDLRTISATMPGEIEIAYDIVVAVLELQNPTTITPRRL